MFLCLFLSQTLTKKNVIFKRNNMMLLHKPTPHDPVNMFFLTKISLQVARKNISHGSKTLL